MDPNERAEIREMISDLIAPLQTELIAQGKLTNLSLNSIDHRLDKINGSVSRHERIISENLPHTTANCAQKTTIQEIRDNMITGKAIKRTIIASITATASIFSVLFILYQIFIK
jgi:hypothetical protein